MTVLELTCDPADDRLWTLDGVGTLRRTGWISRAATAEASGRSWAIARHGWARPGFRAADETGAVVGELKGAFASRGETLRWSGRELALRPTRLRRGGHALLDGERVLATMTPKREGKRPLDVTLEDRAVDPGLLLFVVFVVQARSDDASFGGPTGV